MSAPDTRARPPAEARGGAHGKETVSLPPLLLQAQEAANVARISRRQWDRMVSSGRAPAPVRLGRLVRWRADELRAWVTAGCPSRDQWEREREQGRS